MTSRTRKVPEAGIELASRSDVGQVRSANEDSCDTLERADGTRLLVVADGMGGHQGGATASRTAVATISEIFTQDTSSQLEEMIECAVKAANIRVYQMAQANRELEGMGTTVVAFVLDPALRATVAHAGDSRAYRIRRGQIEALTTDHSVVAEMHHRGLISADEAAIHPRRNEILRSVGVFPEVQVEVAAVDVAPGDRFVLCSDGLSSVICDDEIATVVRSETPGTAVDVLIRMANERGGPDNITVQVLSIPANAAVADPEGTVPVEPSEAGIMATENDRLLHERRHRPFLAAMIILCLVLGATVLWQIFKTAAAGTASSNLELRESAEDSRLAPPRNPKQYSNAPTGAD